MKTSLPLIKSKQNSCLQFLLTTINQKILELDEVITKCFYASSFRVFKPANKQVTNIQSPFTKLWQSCSNLHLKIHPIAIFAFYSLNYSLAARLEDNSRPKSPTKVETKRKLQQFTVSGWLIK